MSEVKYITVTQECHGSERRFLYTVEQFKAEMEKYHIDEYDGKPIDEDFEMEIAGWPIGGSNSSPSMIKAAKDTKEAIAFLTAKAEGPDYDNPPLCALAEYYLEIDDGLATGLLKDNGLDPEECVKKSEKWVQDEIERICYGFDIDMAQFYHEEYEEIRANAALTVADIKDILAEAQDLEYRDEPITIARTIELDGHETTQTLTLTPNKDTEFSEYGLIFNFKLIYTFNYPQTGRCWSEDITFDDFIDNTDTEIGRYTLAQCVNKIVCDAMGLDEDKRMEMIEETEYYE